MALSGIEISAGIVVGSNKPIDAKFGPYATTAAALADIGATLRYKGLTVGIEENGKVVEYWFGNGILNADLVIKISPASEQLTTVESDLAALTTDLASEATRVDGLITAHDTRLTAAETSIAGLGTMSTQDSDDVNITGGTISVVSINAESVEVGVGTTADLYVGQNGKVGIGTEAPTEKLTVNGNISLLNGGLVKNLGTPVDATDAATKSYVDTAVTALEGRASTLESEMDAVEGSVSTLTTDLASEVTRATAAEDVLEGDLAALNLRINDVLENLDPAKIDSFTEVLNKLSIDKGELGDAIVALGTTANSALGDEIARATAAETQLGTDLTAEVTRATAAEQALETSKQLKLTVSDTAPAHADGREWLDTTDYRRYISISGAWIEGVVV